MKVRQISLWLVSLSFAVLSSAYAEDGVKLKFKLNEGDKLVYRLVTEMEQAQSVMGMDINSTMKHDQLLVNTLEKKASNGNFELKQTTKNVKFTANIGGLGDYVFDSKSSDNDTSSLLGAQVTPFFERLTGSEVKLTVTPLGKIEKASGYKELFEDLLESNPLGAQFVAGGTDEAAKFSLQDQFPIFSKKPVQPGDSWEVKLDQELPGMGKFTGKRIFTYQGPDKLGDRATQKIDVSTEMQFEMDLDQGEAQVKGTLSSTGSNGTIHFDNETGQLIKSVATFGLGGELSVTAGGQVIPIEASQTHKVTIELLDKLPE